MITVWKREGFLKAIGRLMVRHRNKRVGGGRKPVALDSSSKPRGVRWACPILVMVAAACGGAASDEGTGAITSTTDASVGSAAYDTTSSNDTGAWNDTTASNSTTSHDTHATLGSSSSDDDETHGSTGDGPMSGDATRGGGSTSGGSTDEGSTGGPLEPVAVCGNGVLEPGEQCDEGADNGAYTGCYTDCTKHKLVFVTSETYNGNLGGVVGANAKCQNLATAAGLSGDFKAWISTDTDWPAKNFTKDPGVAYRMVNGDKVADDWDALTSGTIENAIMWTETGGFAPTSATGCSSKNQYAFTNTKTDGTTNDAVEHCEGWTSILGTKVRLGDYTEKGSKWTAGCSSGTTIPPKCSSNFLLYCFQQ